MTSIQQCLCLSPAILCGRHARPAAEGTVEAGIVRKAAAPADLPIHQYLLTKRVLLAQERLAPGLKPNQGGDGEQK